nr:MiaB/RimO family radical SAM methylthiotransferase [Fimbriimonadaceae bacterium]
TLLGQTVNSYGKNLLEGRVPLSQLLWKIAEIDGIERIRYTSPYPRDFKDDLIEAIRDCPKVMEHCHLPLQSGNDEVLKEMKRLYSVDGFRTIVGKLREAVPSMGITTDLIVGFPGETEEQFEDTLKLYEELRFDGAYMFIYSPRQDTPAADMEQLPYPVKQARLARLNELHNRIAVERNEEVIGKTLEVLVEGKSPKDPGSLQGYSREFKMVHFPGSESRIGRLAQVRVKSAHLWGVRGELV